MNITLGQREHLLEMLDCEYVISDEFKTCVKAALKKHATRNYSEAIIEYMVEKPISLASSISSLGTTREGDLSLFRGKMVEWLLCIEYNSLKNKGNVVMTIVNPDPSSTADLLHIIETRNGYQCIAGPDVKCGDAYYVFNQWKKIVTERTSIPMIDVDGIFSDEEVFKNRHPRLWKQFQQLKQDFPKKTPLPSSWDKQNISRMLMDYLRYKGDGVTPSTSDDKPLPENFSKSVNCNRIKEAVLISSDETHHQAGWDVFCRKAHELPYVPVDYLNPRSVEIQRQKEFRKQVIEAQKKAERVEKRTISSEPRQQGWLNKLKVKANHFAATQGYSSVEQMAWGLTKMVGRRACKEFLNDAPNIIANVLFRKVEKSETAKRKRSSHVKKSSEIELDKQEPQMDNSPSEETLREPATHASPTEHEVSEHEQTYHTKEGTITRKKQPYRRGGKG